jgi:hypothetical protein
MVATGSSQSRPSHAHLKSPSSLYRFSIQVARRTSYVNDFTQVRGIGVQSTFL